MDEGVNIPLKLFKITFLLITKKEYSRHVHRAPGHQISHHHVHLVFHHLDADRHHSLKIQLLQFLSLVAPFLSDQNLSCKIRKIIFFTLVQKNQLTNSKPNKFTIANKNGVFLTLLIEQEEDRTNNTQNSHTSAYTKMQRHKAEKREPQYFRYNSY